MKKMEKKDAAAKSNKAGFRMVREKDGIRNFELATCSGNGRKSANSGLSRNAGRQFETFGSRVKKHAAPAPEVKSLSGMQRIAEGFLLVLVVLLPLKFAGLALMPEMPGFFPEDWFGYLFASWPPAVFGCFSGAALLLALLAFPVRAPGKVLGLWCAVIVTSLPGFCRASALDTGVAVMVHLLALGALTAAAHLILISDPAFRRKLLIALSFAAALVISSGLYQYFWGFKEQQAFFREHGTMGMNPGKGFTEKIYEERVFATFGSCNVFGGYLLLILPLLVLGARRWGLFHRSRVLGDTAAALCTAAGLFLLWRTGSRSAMLAGAGAAALAAWLLLPSRKLKIAAMLAAVAVGCAGAFYFSSRSLGSVEERFGYWKTSCKMMLRNPLCGSGWGDFFIDHMREKKAGGNDEAAHMPHNLLLDFGCQSGIPAMLAVLALLFFPMRDLQRRLRRKRTPEDACLFFGLLAFLIHAMLDIDFQSLGTMGNLLLLLLLCEDPAGQGAQERGPFERRYGVLYGALALSAAISGAYAVTAEKRLDELQQRMKDPGASWVQMKLACAAVEKLRPFSPYHWLDYGDWLFARQDFYGALNAYRTALQRAPERPATYYRLYRVSLAMGDPRATEYLQEASRRFPAEKRYRKELQR